MNDRVDGEFLFSTRPYVDSGSYTLPRQYQAEPTDTPTQVLLDSIYKPGDFVDNNYRLDYLLGRGGMGIVYACHHRVLDKSYALKLLYGAELTDELWQRFKDEAKALARLRHPNIVGIHNMGIDRGRCPFYVMDLLSGEALDTLLRQSGRLEVGQALDLFIDVADALGTAHASGIIHRDIKPSNLMLVRDGGGDGEGEVVSVKVVDFGIARVAERNNHGADPLNQYRTLPGIIFGTPYYMSPEQCQGSDVDHRSDIYSLGCTLFEALTGTVPFCGKNAFHTYILHQNAAPPSLVSCGLKALDERDLHSLERAVARMLAKDPSQRYQSMAQVKHDLSRIRAGKSIVTRTAGDGDNNSIAIGALAPGLELARAGCRDRIGAVIGSLCVLAVGLAMILYLARPTGNDLFAQKSPSPEGINSASAPAVVSSFVDEIGADTEEVDRALSYGPDTSRELRRFQDLSRPFIQDPLWCSTKFKINSPISAFNFPRTFTVGAIKVGDNMPVFARGRILAPQAARVCLYINDMTADCPELFNKFGDDDATGLEVVTAYPSAMITRLSRWKRLDQLSFFNSILKAPPGCMEWEESNLSDKNLPEIDKFSRLKSLGLCGPGVTGAAITRMKLLSTIDTLKIKRISGQQALLDALPQHENIRELWLVGQGTTDAQLELLTGLDNLQVLRIRGSRLTPASLEIFKRMSSLRELWLDRNSWSEADKELFRKTIPGCKFEKVVDSTFWFVVPH